MLGCIAYMCWVTTWYICWVYVLGCIAHICWVTTNMLDNNLWTLLPNIYIKVLNIYVSNIYPHGIYVGYHCHTCWVTTWYICWVYMLGNIKLMFPNIYIKGTQHISGFNFYFKFLLTHPLGLNYLNFCKHNFESFWLRMSLMLCNAWRNSGP